MFELAKNLNDQNCVNSKANCVHYMYRISGCVKKLNIQNNYNSTGNWVHYICTEWLDLQKNWISKAAKIHRKIVHVIYARNGWNSKKIECQMLQKFNGKLCTLYMYGMYGLAEKSNIQNSVNSTRNCARYIRTECLN